MKRNGKILLALVLIAALCAGGWYWYDTTVDRSGWKTQDGIRYYRDFYGDYVTGWQTIDGEQYHFAPDHSLTCGWLEDKGNRYYFSETGEMRTGWIQIGESTYCFGDDGAMRTGWVEGRYLTADGTPASGWLEDDGKRYYLADGGTPISGPTEIDGKTYYFLEDGTMHRGWSEFSGTNCFFGPDGAMAIGWTTVDEQLYYFREDGAMVTGWLELGEYTYYLHSDGTAASGPTEIDGEVHYFTPKGIRVVLVNPWHHIPDWYDADLVKTLGGHLLDSACVQALEQMMADCEAAGLTPKLSSSYRPHSTQVMLYNRKVDYWMDQGYTESYARHLAGTSVALPGTSEHQLGLAVDIVDNRYTSMDRAQSDTATQQWLMEHCWKYGFILRYPDGSSEITGIIFEPWHYRYVGTEVSLELQRLGITLEEYLGAVSES